MMTSHIRISIFRAALSVALITGLSGCPSTGGTKKTSPQDYSAILGRAEADVTAGRVDDALIAFDAASKADPGRKEPWVRTAQLQFDKGNYARAILAAEEVLQRDPTDLVADSVLTVGGFRIANQSLNRLKGNGALASGTARTEAELLVSTLKATMGDDIVGGPVKSAPARSSTKPSRTSRAGRGSTPATSSQPASEAPTADPIAAPEKKPSSDPFHNIGGN